ncbi:hypothetical protein [Aquisediminimonas sediminicola]|uniref:hypothetical protein n=1 Tax=Alteraquisediminimonas sediminicola TaxID=2676787 RepID=UPI001C8E7649|nr:hypothetical protein [Aquisediminimonas sediminicola]
MNGELCDPVQTEAYFTRLFQHVDFAQGQLISLLGVGEKGTEREGIKPERQFLPPTSGAKIMECLRRWAEWHLASFAVPAVLHGSAAIAGDVKLDKVALMTAIILDIDSGDIAGKCAFVTDRLGKPSMTIASGGSTSEG